MLKIAICDDDKKDRDRISGFVSDFLREKNMMAEVKVFDHPDSLIKECEVFRPHIYLLDIVMPMITGIQAARELRWNQPEAQIIFATSEKSFALESFDVNPINYIVKPVDKDKLFETLELAMRRVDITDEKTVTVKVKGGLQTVFYDDILYIDYRNHVVTYHLISGELISTTTLRISFAEYLKTNITESCMIQCHESIAVNIKAMDKLTKTDITVRNKEIIPVSKSRYADVAEAYMNYRFNI